MSNYIEIDEAEIGYMKIEELISMEKKYKFKNDYIKELVYVLSLVSKDTYKENINEIKSELLKLPPNIYFISCEYIKTNFTCEIQKKIFERIMLAFILPYSYDFKRIFMYMLVKGKKEDIYNFIVWFSNNMNNYCLYTQSDFINQIKCYFSEVDRVALRDKKVLQKLMASNNEIIKSVFYELSYKPTMKEFIIALVSAIKSYYSIDRGITWFSLIRNVFISITLLLFSIYLFMQTIYFGNHLTFYISVILLACCFAIIRFMPHN